MMNEHSDNARAASAAGRSMGRYVAEGEVRAAPRIACAGSRSLQLSIAVFSEWRGKAFYLNVRYRARSRRPEDDFIVRPSGQEPVAAVESSRPDLFSDP
jgi:hypothetical protein